MNNPQFLIQKIKRVYNGCIFGKKSNNILIQSIIPIYLLSNIGKHLLFSKYLYIPIADNLIQDYNNFRISIYPEPITIFYQNINNKVLKGGMFKAIDINNNSMNVVLLYNSNIFLKYHFLKFLEINKLNIYDYQYESRYVNSDLYLNNVIYQISKISSDNIFDYYGNNIIL